ncbi:hypothetical protein ACLKA6_018459 [Drosophila palustris]
MNVESPTKIHSVCRTCLSNLQLDEAFDLFAVPGLAKKLCVCTSLSVEPQDEFPNTICYSCHSRLNDMHDFQKQCVDAVQRFKELVSRNCFIEDEPSVVNAALQDDVDEQEINILHPHLNSKIEIDNEEVAFQIIDDVDKEFEDVDNSEDAFNDCGSGYNNKDVDSSNSDDEMPLTRLRRSSRATKPKGTNNDKEKDSSDSKPLGKMKTKEKTRDGIIVGQFCPDDCKIHERLHTRNDCFECSICGRNFLFESRLTKHWRTHEKRKNKATASSTTTETDGDAQKKEKEPEAVMKVPNIPAKLKDPRRVEVVDISQLAGTAFNPFPSLSKSSKTPQEDFAKNEGQHKCPECGKNFNKKKGIKRHIKTVHDKVKDFACRFCPKRFSKSNHLRHHEYTHTGEKPYECIVCNKTFRHDATLRKHMKSHNRPRKEPKDPKKPKPKDLSKDPSWI